MTERVKKPTRRHIDTEPLAAVLLAVLNLPHEQFTIEAYIFLRSVFDDGTVRTIASHWNGDTKAPGWAIDFSATSNAAGCCSISSTAPPAIS